MTHERDENGSFGSFVLGLSLGAGVGAVIALLKAPRAGDEMRQQMQYVLGEMRKEAMSVAGVVNTHLQEAKGELTQHLADIKTESQSALQESKRLLTETMQEGENQAQPSPPESVA
ncbi:MAG: YtxH domain-containing protein [Chloroflexota bacterium]